MSSRLSKKCSTKEGVRRKIAGHAGQAAASWSGGKKEKRSYTPGKVITKQVTGKLKQVSREAYILDVRPNDFRHYDAAYVDIIDFLKIVMLESQLSQGGFRKTYTIQPLYSWFCWLVV